MRQQKAPHFGLLVNKMFILRLHNILESMSVVVSVRIKKETKEALERSGIDISLVTRNYLERLAWKSRRIKNVKELHRLIEKNVKPSGKGFSVESIREDRDSAH